MDRYTPEQRRTYTNEYRERRRQEAKQFLGGVCANCGSVDDLEFDHIDPSTKVSTIAKLWTASLVAFWKEVEKCQLLCHSCHEKKSIEEGSFSKPKPRPRNHGSTGYRYGCRCDICLAYNDKRNLRRRKQG